MNTLAWIARITLGCVVFLPGPAPAASGAGDLDSGFGIGGSLQAPAGFGALVVLPGGELQLVKFDGGSLKVLRMGGSGQPQAAFGVAGQLQSPTGFGPVAPLTALALEGGATLVSVSVSSGLGSHVGLVRIRPDGQLDTGFGSGGLRTLANPDTASIATLSGLASGPDGRTFVAVSYSRSIYDDCSFATHIYRLSASGDLDAGFGDNGEVRATGTCGYSVLLLPRVGGGVYAGDAMDALLDAHGRTEPLPAPWQQWLKEHPFRSVFQDRDSVYTTSFDARGNAMLVVKWSPDLAVDTHFGIAGQGFATISLDALPGQPVRMLYYTESPAAAQSGPYLYLRFGAEGGPDAVSHVDQQWEIIARLHRDGSLDTGFGDRGFAWSSFLPLMPQVQQPDGGLIAASERLGTVRIAGPGPRSAGVLGIPVPASCGMVAFEPLGKVSVVLARELGQQGAVSLRYSTKDGIAVAGADYRPVTGTLAWADGESAPKSIEIPLVQDTVQESTENFLLQLEVESGGARLHCSSVEITVGGDGPAPATVSAGSTGAVGNSSGGGGAADPFALALLALLLFRLLYRSRAMLLAAALVPVLASAAPGDLDPGFGIDGRLIFPPAYGGLAALPDGRLQLAALMNGHLLVTRMDENARPAPLSGTDIQVGSPVAPVKADVLRATVDADGRTYLSLRIDKGETAVQLPGAVEIVQESEAGLMRLLPDGTPDRTFGEDGIRVFPASRVANAHNTVIIDFAVGANGSIYVLVDYFYQPYDTDFGLRLFRLRADGQLDRTFGNDGEYRVNGIDYKYWQPQSLLLLAGGKVLLQSSAGEATAIGPTGLQESVPQAWRNALQSSDRMTVASAGQFRFLATSSAASGLVIDISRWHPDLAIDATFGDAGTGHTVVRVADPKVSFTEYGTLRLLAPRGAEPYLYLATDVQNSGLYGTLVLRLLADGRLDRSFGIDGFAFDYGWLTPVIQQGNGSAIVTSGERAAFRLHATSLESPGHVVMPLSCTVANIHAKSSDALKIPVARSLGSAGAVEVRYRTQLVRSNYDPAWKEVEGVLRWEAGEVGSKTFEVPGVLDSFDVMLEAIAGQPIIDCARARILVDGVGTVSPPPSLPSPSVSSRDASESAGGGGLDGLALLLLCLLLVAHVRWRRVPAYRPMSSATEGPYIRSFSR